jgi:hypothetical protein
MNFFTAAASIALQNPRNLHMRIGWLENENHFVTTSPFEMVLTQRNGGGGREKDLYTIFGLYRSKKLAKFTCSAHLMSRPTERGNSGECVGCA